MEPVGAPLPRSNQLAVRSHRAPGGQAKTPCGWETALGLDGGSHVGSRKPVPALPLGTSTHSSMSPTTSVFVSLPEEVMVPLRSLGRVAAPGVGTGRGGLVSRAPFSRSTPTHFIHEPGGGTWGWHLGKVIPVLRSAPRPFLVPDSCRLDVCGAATHAQTALRHGPAVARSPLVAEISGSTPAAALVKTAGAAQFASSRGSSVKRGSELRGIRVPLSVTALSQ
ncbi:unnamed protein product [Lampetra planeri]